MAFVCFVYLCDVHHFGKRIYKQCSGIYQEWQGRQRARVPPPPPPRAERRLGYPRANFFYFSKQFFFYFFLPYPITSSIYPFSFPLRGFLFLCVYFPIRVSFRVSEGKKTGKLRIVFLVLPMSVWLLYALFSFSAIFLCCVFLLCFSAVSPYCFSLCVMFLHCLLLWMLCFSLICLFFCPLWGFLCFYV